MATLISLEDHFLSEAQGAGANGREVIEAFPPEMITKLRDLGTLRMQDMEKGNMALQIVSGTPADEPLDVCVKTNNQLAEAVSKSKGRLGAFGSLPMCDPDAAAQELERCVNELGFVGAMIPNHVSGRYYHGPEYRSFWRRAEGLNVPIYIHPCSPTTAQKEAFAGVPPQAQWALGEFAWGWHADVGLHMLKLWASGLFEKNATPRLKIIIGHDGELLPFMIGRSNRALSRVMNKDKPERSLTEVWRENFWVTLSGFWDLAPLACLLRTTTIDRIMYSLDYPYAKPEEGRDFMVELQKSGLVSAEEFDMIAYQNAEKLLGVKRPK